MLVIILILLKFIFFGGLVEYLKSMKFKNTNGPVLKDYMDREIMSVLRYKYIYVCFLVEPYLVCVLIGIYNASFLLFDRLDDGQSDLIKYESGVAKTKIQISDQTLSDEEALQKIIIKDTAVPQNLLQEYITVVTKPTISVPAVDKSDTIRPETTLKSY